MEFRTFQPLVNDGAEPIPQLGYVTVKVQLPSNMTRSGLLAIPEERLETFAIASTVGEIIAYGPLAWHGLKQHPQVGDTVQFNQYSGSPTNLNGVYYRTVHDRDVLAIIPGAKYEPY